VNYHAIRRRQGNLLAQGLKKQLVVCDYGQIAEQTLSFVVSVEKRTYNWDAVSKEEGDINITKGKAIDHFSVRRETTESDIENEHERYIESDLVVDRLACRYGSQLLCRHPELIEVGRGNISSMSMRSVSGVITSSTGSHVKFQRYCTYSPTSLDR
jgi:hypothetical protein